MIEDVLIEKPAQPVPVSVHPKDKFFVRQFIEPQKQAAVESNEEKASAALEVQAKPLPEALPEPENLKQEQQASSEKLIIQKPRKSSDRQLKKEAKKAAEAEKAKSLDINSIDPKSIFKTEYPEGINFTTQRYGSLFQDLMQNSDKVIEYPVLANLFNPENADLARYPMPQEYNRAVDYYFVIDDEIDAKMNQIGDLLNNFNKTLSKKQQKALNKYTLGLFRTRMIDTSTGNLSEHYFCGVSGVPKTVAKVYLRKVIDNYCQQLGFIFVDFPHIDIHALLAQVNTQILKKDYPEGFVINKLCVEKMLLTVVLKQSMIAKELSTQQNKHFSIEVGSFKTIQFSTTPEKGMQDYFKYKTVPPCGECTHNKEATLYILKHAFNDPEFGLQLKKLSSGAFQIPTEGLEKIVGSEEAKRISLDKEEQEKAGIHGRFGIDARPGLGLETSFNDAEFLRFKAEYLSRHAKPEASQERSQKSEARTLFFARQQRDQAESSSSHGLSRLRQATSSLPIPDSQDLTEDIAADLLDFGC